MHMRMEHASKLNTACGIIKSYQGSGMGLQTGGTRDHFTHPCSTHQGGCFGAKKIKIDQGNPKLGHGQGSVND